MSNQLEARGLFARTGCFKEGSTDLTPDLLPCSLANFATASARKAKPWASTLTLRVQNAQIQDT